MDVVEEALTNEKYKKQIDRLGTKALEVIANDPVKALETAYKGVNKVEPEKAKDLEYLQAQANMMQKFAEAVLKKRSKK